MSQEPSQLTQMGPDQTAPSFRLDGLEVFGNYRIIGPLARGGMAELSLAIQVGMQGFSRVVALKRVLPSNGAEPAFEQMFLDEARLAAKLDHPAIVRIYELGVEQGRYFHAMEYLPGEDLHHLAALVAAAQTEIAPATAAVIVERAAGALHFAHEATDAQGHPLGLVHRDVNPANILLTYQGQVKLVDFGIAKAASNTFETAVGMIKGKMAYLAPEQFTDGMEIDRRCDVFGLGIVLWELLAGTPLFRRDSQAATLLAVRDGVVPPLSELRADVELQLEEIVTKALARSPADRYQSAAELEEALHQYLGHRGARPSDRELGRWLETLGGQRRSELKQAIARGTNVRSSFEELTRLLVPASATAARPPSVTALRPRPLWQAAAFLLAGAALVAGAWFAPGPRSTHRASRAPVITASVQLDSEPAGAFVFVKGEPTGRTTPATLGGLPPGSLALRLQKPGYAPVEAVIALEAGKQLARSFALVAEQGLVRFAHLAPGGQVRVRGKTAQADEQLELAPGSAQLEVLVSGKVVQRREVTIVVGPQTVDLRR